MSTPLAHVAAGLAVYFSHSRLRSPHTIWALPCFVLLAVLPDFDYLMIWCFGIRQEPRGSHSLFFCLLAGMLAWLLARRRMQLACDTRPIGVSGFLLAALSHVALDFSVGAHSLPIFWPLVDSELMSPVAVLPSVIHAKSVMNYALWRNALLECAVLVPVLMFLVARARAVAVGSILWRGRFFMPVWCVALACSLLLPR